MSEAWPIVPFGRIAKKLVNGGTPLTDVPRYWSGHIPWITGADFTPSGIGEFRRFVSVEAVSHTATNVIQQGQLLLVTRTGVGKFAIAPCDIAISQDITGVYVDEDLATTEFIFYRMRQGVEDFKKLNQGTSINGIIRSDLVSYLVGLPPLPQQRRIAEILSTLDEAIEQTEALIVKMQQVKAGLMHDLFTRGVTPDGHLRLTREQAPELYKESPLGWIPKEWEVGDVENVITGIEQGWSPDCETEPASDQEWGVLKTSSVVWGGFNRLENKRLPQHMSPRTDLKIKKGDVLVTRAGPNSRVGVVALVDIEPGKLILSDKIYRLVPSAGFSGEYLTIALSSAGTQHDLDAHKTGLAESQTNISQAIVRRLKLPIPPKVERQTFCDRIRTASVQLIENSQHLAKWQTIKNGLMHDLLTGNVRVAPVDGQGGSQ
jgi:type I restriction enzyme S subunit